MSASPAPGWAKSEYTPTPWRADGFTVRAVDRTIATDVCVAVNREEDMGASTGDLAMQRANAAFIARACNSHTELYDALRALVNCHAGAAWQSDTVRREAFVRAQAALSRAESGGE